MRAVKEIPGCRDWFLEFLDLVEAGNAARAWQMSIGEIVR